MNWQDSREEEEDPGEGCSHNWNPPGQARDVKGEVGVVESTHGTTENGERIEFNVQGPEEKGPSSEPERPLSP